VLKFIRERPELRSVRVIVISNSFLSGLAREVAEAKVDKSLTKSDITPTQLIEVVREVLATPATSNDATPSSAPPPPGAAKESEVDFQDRVQREFFERIPGIVQGLRKMCREFLEAADAPTETQRLADMIRKIGFLDQMTTMAGCPRLAQLLSAVEALLVELHQRPALINDSVRQTVVSTTAFIADRLDSTMRPEEPGRSPPSVLVVDDDAVSNRAVVMALGAVNLQATNVSDAFDALKRLAQTPFDLVLLDIHMPGMDGIALCEEMRAMQLHKRTPVIFVTGLTDFKTRARTVLSGGDDLITKPVLPLELVVKAITLLLKKGYSNPSPR
jgi:CheY-like chemotaxis protein